jgi:8-oxo-dGTP pyrophosphatase MutT (NUDIX family)
MSDHVTSAGIVALRRSPEAGVEVFLVQERSGRWGLPKGRQEAGEDLLQTATRELKEETGFDVDKLLASEPRKEGYEYAHRGLLRVKQVFYFAATVTGSELAFPTSEIRAGEWLTLERVRERVGDGKHAAICDIVSEFAGLLP